MFIAANFHFQMRVHTNLYLVILNQEFKEEIRAKLEGFDFSVCNPVGPINLKMSLMLRKFSLDTYLRGKEISTSVTVDRKKYDIFGDAQGQDSIMRQHVVPASNSGGEVIMNVVSYRKLRFNLDFDTQVDLHSNIVNILTVDGTTGSFNLKVSTLLTKKFESFKKSLIPDPDPLRDMRSGRRAAKLKINVAKMASKFYKNKGLGRVVDNSAKASRNISSFGSLNLQDVTVLIIKSRKD